MSNLKVEDFWIVPYENFELVPAPLMTSSNWLSNKDFYPKLLKCLQIRQTKQDEFVLSKMKRSPRLFHSICRNSPSPEFTLTMAFYRVVVGKFDSLISEIHSIPVSENDSYFKTYRYTISFNSEAWKLAEMLAASSPREECKFLIKLRKTCFVNSRYYK